MLKNILLTITLSATVFLSEKPGSAAISAVIEGVVTNEKKQPLQNVHLYVILGEEEAFTNDKGEFSFKTYQSFPLKLMVESKGYEEKTIALTAAPPRLSIVLKQK